MTTDETPAAKAAADWSPAPVLQAIERIREHVLTEEALTPEDRRQLLATVDALEREASHPERNPDRLRQQVGVLGSAAEEHHPRLLEVLGPDRIAALSGLLPHV